MHILYMSLSRRHHTQEEEMQERKRRRSFLSILTIPWGLAGNWAQFFINEEQRSVHCLRQSCHQKIKETNYQVQLQCRHLLKLHIFNKYRVSHMSVLFLFNPESQIISQKHDMINISPLSKKRKIKLQEYVFMLRYLTRFHIIRKCDSL